MRIGHGDFGKGRSVGQILLLILALLLGFTLLAAAPTSTPMPRTALLLRIDGAIGPAIADYLGRELRRADEERAPLVILEMDTPGGLESSMRAMIRDILASPVPVVTYVSPSGARAASAGTFILYASHVAAMAPGTNVGAATPVQIGAMPGAPDEPAKGDGKAKDKPSTPMEAKAVNDAAAFIRSLAELRDRNVEWGEKAVREAASLSAGAALKEGVIDIQASGLKDLIRQINGRKVVAAGRTIQIDSRGLAVRHVKPDWRTRLLATITDPNVALILMMIGVYGLIFEFMSPGAFLPGTLGAICLLVALYAFAALPVNFAGATLILLGIGLLIAEGFMFSHGILGVGGIVSFVLGAAMLINTDVPEFRLSPSVIGGVALASAAFILMVMRAALSARRRKVVSGAEEMVGAPGTVLDWSAGRGHVFAHGERWAASGDGRLREGQPVRITGVRGLTVRVEPDRAKEA